MKRSDRFLAVGVLAVLTIASISIGIVAVLTNDIAGIVGCFASALILIPVVTFFGTHLNKDKIGRFNIWS